MFSKLKMTALVVAGFFGFSAAAMAADDTTAAVITAVTTGATQVQTSALSMLTSIIPIAIGVLAAVMVFRFGKRLISGLL